MKVLIGNIEIKTTILKLVNKIINMFHKIFTDKTEETADHIKVTSFVIAIVNENNKHEKIKRKYRKSIKIEGEVEEE